MTLEPQTATLMRIFLNEADRCGKRPLYMAVVDELRANGFAGATVLKGIEGYGRHAEVRAARSFDFSANLPVLVEVADADERVRSVVPVLQKLIPEGLITLEKIRMEKIQRPPRQLDGGGRL